LLDERQEGVGWFLRPLVGDCREKDIVQNVLRPPRLRVHGPGLRGSHTHVYLTVYVISFCTFLEFDYHLSSPLASSTYFQVSRGCPSSGPILQVHSQGHARSSSKS